MNDPHANPKGAPVIPMTHRARPTQPLRWIRIAQIILLFLFVACFPAFGQSVRVARAVGEAPGNQENSRHLAIQHALREAVRQGAGANVLQLQDVNGHQLTADRLTIAAFGYVESYEIVDEGLKSDGMYRVTIRAQVGKGSPAMQDQLALQQVLTLRGSPRVIVRVDEQIEDVPPSEQLSRAWFERAAQKIGLNLLDERLVREADERKRLRDDRLGYQQDAEFLDLGLGEVTDFVIDATIRGEWTEYRIGGHGERPVTEEQLSLTMDLRFLQPGRGALPVTVSLPAGDRFTSRRIGNRQAKATAILADVLDPGGKGHGPGWELFVNLIANWVRELDLGSFYRVEIWNVEADVLNRIVADLRQNPQITLVRPREQDRQGRSVLEARSLFERNDLASRVLGVLGKDFVEDRATSGEVTFRRKGAARAPDQGTDPSSKLPAGSVPARSVPAEAASAWIWPVVGCGILVLVAGVFLLGKSAGRRRP